MKRFLTLLLALTLSLGLLAGCDIQSTPTDAPTDAPAAAPTEAPTEPEPTKEGLESLQDLINQQLQEQNNPTDPAKPIEPAGPEVLNLGNDLKVFWDDYLIDPAQTTAELTQHSPRFGEVVMEFDKPWEGDGTDYFCTIYDNGVYKMYYLGWQMLGTDADKDTVNGICVCVIESTDGIHWYRPELDFFSCPGYEKTNVILSPEDDVDFDNFFVFIDTNPACPAEERYKGVARDGDSGFLVYWVSADGYDFEKKGLITMRGKFDSLNTAMWSEAHQKYFCFFRDFHGYSSPNYWGVDGIRDIRVMESTDFKHWTPAKLLDYGEDARDIALYTNCIQPYYRDKSILVGMPSRYVERKAWTGNFTQLPDKDARQERMKYQQRYGLTTTDCVLMTSRDGYRWNRQEEAWLTPGIERDYNWVYGDCYPTVGFVETPSDLPGAPNELSYYCFEKHWSAEPALLRRYTGRIDGLLSYHAKAEEQVVVTKPIAYEGGKLHLNFSTSALGYIYVTVSDGENSVTSCELFGDSLDRWVNFDGPLSQFEGKEITLTFTMSDADLYAMQFVDE